MSPGGLGARFLYRLLSAQSDLWVPNPNPNPANSSHLAAWLMALAVRPATTQNKCFVLGLETLRQINLKMIKLEEKIVDPGPEQDTAMFGPGLLSASVVLSMDVAVEDVSEQSVPSDVTQSKNQRE